MEAFPVTYYNDFDVLPYMETLPYMDMLPIWELFPYGNTTDDVLPYRYGNSCHIRMHINVCSSVPNWYITNKENEPTNAYFV